MFPRTIFGSLSCDVCVRSLYLGEEGVGRTLEVGEEHTAGEAKMPKLLDQIDIAEGLQ